MVGGLDVNSFVISLSLIVRDISAIIGYLLLQSKFLPQIPQTDSEFVQRMPFVKDI
jgi:hypothetical protein